MWLQLERAHGFMTSYTERLHLKLTVRQLFDLVADVGPTGNLCRELWQSKSPGMRVNRSGWT
jgi:hypothetical protein